MPLPNVKKFYKFWFEFNSWREFSQYDEYDVSEACDRYERRYMEQENKRCRAKYVKAERARILRLVELAHDNDPRIRKEREEIEAEKQRKRDEIRARKQAAAKVKEDAIRKRQEEREAEERAKQEGIEAAARAKKAADLAYKNAVKELITLCEETLAGTNYDRFWVEGKQRTLFQTIEKLQVFQEKITEIKAREDLDQAGRVQIFE